MIKKIKLDEINEVMEIIEDAKKLLKKSSLQWQQGYPNLQTMKNDIINGDLYGYYIDELNNYLVGIIALVYGFNPDYERIEGNWKYKTGDYDFTIHRIAVREGYHNQKIGDKLIKFAIKEAKENMIKSIKIDTHISNLPMQKLALNNGFVYKGIITLVRDELDNTRLAYELALKDDSSKMSICGYVCTNCPLYIATETFDLEKIRKINHLKNDDIVNVQKHGCFGCNNCLNLNLIASNCNIKKCANEKNLDSCSNCEKFPCPILSKSISNESIENLKKLKNNI